MLIQQNSPRKVVVTFKAHHAGIFHTSLNITFSDKTRPNSQEFTIVRQLRGCAILPGGPANSGGTPNTVEENTTWGEGTGITVSPGFGLEFSVERSSPDEPFVQQTKELTITTSTVTPSGFFKNARVYSPDDSVARCVHVWLRRVVSHFLDLIRSWFSAWLEGNSKWIKYDHQRIVTICFAPQREGHFEATLELTLCNHTSKADFVIKRTLIGLAKQSTSGQRPWRREHESAPIPGTSTIDDWEDSRLSSDEEELLDSDDTGISVSHEDGLDFCVVERKRRNGRFDTLSSLLTIRLADGFPAVTFVKERMKTSDGCNPGCAIIAAMFHLYSSPR
jgi:hypothetical protein